MSSQKRVLTTRIRNAYHQYFGLKLEIRRCCSFCMTALNELAEKKGNAIFSVNDLESSLGGKFSYTLCRI